jgi:hypothetical protein
VLFSTETGDAWLLDASDQLAARLARDGDPDPIQIEDTETTFAIGWEGSLPHRGDPHSSTWIGIPGGRPPFSPDAFKLALMK